MSEAVRKRVLYVGGLAENVHEETVHAAFIPFGDISQIHLPKDALKNKGFAFVEFEEEEDAEEARFNMDGAELYGRSLRVSIAKAESHGLNSTKAVWSADSWFQNLKSETA